MTWSGHGMVQTDKSFIQPQVFRLEVAFTSFSHCYQLKVDESWGARHRSVVKQLSIGSLDRYLMVDPLRYFSFQPVLHDWCNKGCGMCNPVCGVVHIN